MAATPTVLLCDHRGSGLARRLAGLERGGWRVEATDSVRRSLERLAGPPPDALVLDPLIEGGAVEVEALDRAGGGQIPLLLLADPARVAEALAVLARSPERDTDLAHRDADLVEVGARLDRLVSACASRRELAELRHRALYDDLARSPERVADLAHRDADAVEVGARLDRLAGACASRRELAELRHRALYDDRTELLRPEAFQRRLVEHWSAAERHGHELALVIADLDRFGQFNKTYDHTVGDRVLVRVSEAIRSALRTEDVAGRLGGDEFGCVLPYTKKVDAARVVHRLRERIRAVSGKIGGADLVISASLGFETFDGRDIESVDVLRSHAESALREAKRRGGDRALYYRLLSPAAGA